MRRLKKTLIYLLAMVLYGAGFGRCAGAGWNGSYLAYG